MPNDVSWMLRDIDVDQVPTPVVEGKGHDTFRLTASGSQDGLSAFDFAIMGLRDISDEDFERVKQAWASQTPLEDWLPYHTAEVLNACGYCGHWQYETNGFVLRATAPCPHPDGLEFSVDLDVPSGKILVGNDFRDVFFVKNDDFYVNEPREIKRCTEAYATEAQMLHFFVGNSCPGIYRMADDPDHLICASPNYSVEDEGPEPIEGVASYEAGVITDLWWVCMVDAEEGTFRGVEDPHAQIIKVTPGTYRLTYHALRKDFPRWEDPRPEIYADLRRVT